jgi:hypothetical protein
MNESLPRAGKRRHPVGVGGDVLSSGPDEPARVPRGLVAVAALLALLAVVQGARHLGRDGSRDGKGTTAQRRETPAPGGVAGSLPPVPSTGLQLLAGGRDLMTVETDTGAVSTLDDSGWRHRGQVVGLLSRTAGQVVVVRARNDPAIDRGSGHGADRAWLVPPRGPAQALGPANAVAPAGENAVALVAATPSAVSVRTLRLDPVVPIGGTVRLPPGTTVVAGSPLGLLVETRAGGAAALQLRDPRVGALLRTLARPAHALVADGRRVAWLRPGCDERCQVHLTDLRTGADQVVANVRGERVRTAALAADGRVALAGMFRLVATGFRGPALVVSGPAPSVVLSTPLASVPSVLAWSPSGYWLFLTDPPRTAVLAWARPDGSLFRVPAPSGLLADVAFLTVMQS